MTDADPTEAPPTAAPSRGAAYTAFLVVAIDLLGFGIVLPLLPRYAEGFLPGDTPREIRGLTVGVLMVIFSAMQFLVAPIWGRISDRIGRRPVLLLGLTGSVFAYALFGYASELTGWLAVGLVFASRVGAGIAGATISTAAAVIADSTPPQQRARGMALIGAAFGVGFTFGPLVAFAAIQFFPEHQSATGYLAAALSLAALIFAALKLPETRRLGGPAAPHRGFSFGRLYQTLQTPTVGLLVLAFFLATFGFANFEGTLSLFTKSAFDYSDKQNSLIFAYIGAVLMVAQGGVYRPMARRYGEVTFIRLGVLLMFLGLLALGALAIASQASSPVPGLLAWFMAALACAVFGFSFLNPSIQSLISRRSDPNRQGEVLGVNQSFSALARILGPLVGMGVFYLEPTHVLPYVVAAALLGVVLALVPRIRREKSPG